MASARKWTPGSPLYGCGTALVTPFNMSGSIDEGALRDAKASDARWAPGKPLSPLDGVPVPIK